MSKIFLEIVVAPSYTKEALDILCQKKNLRVLRLPEISAPLPKDGLDTKKVLGGLLVQGLNNKMFDGEFKVVTKRKPTDEEMENLEFAFKVVIYGIAIAKDMGTLGIGPGQTNRIWLRKWRLKEVEKRQRER